MKDKGSLRLAPLLFLKQLKSHVLVTLKQGISFHEDEEVKIVEDDEL